MHRKSVWKSAILLCGLFASSIACLRSASYQSVRAGQLKDSAFSESATIYLMKAVDANDFRAAAKSLELHGNPNVRNPNVSGRSLLMIASGWGSVGMVKLLVRHGADVNSRDDDGQTALVYAIDKGNFESAIELLSNHADPNIRDSKGHTALKFANNEHPTHNKNLHHEDWVGLRKVLKLHGAKL